MGHTIEVRKSSRSRAIGRQRLQRLTRRGVRVVLDGEGMNEAEVGVWFVDDPTIRRLNRQYRRMDRTTDVIAFGLSDRRERMERGVLLGDVVVSVTAARRQANFLGHPLEAELALLLIHGVLHLLGHDHERLRCARAMRRKEGRYLAICGIRAINNVLA
jgi:probable rRNA maturation factor